MLSSFCPDEAALAAYLEGRLETSAALERHIDACPVCRLLVTSLAAHDDDKSMDPPAEIRGRYVIRSQRGRGGQSQVWLAFDRVMGREIALKEFAARSSSSADESAHRQAEARFVREVRLTAALDHPAIVRIHEFGTRARGSLYYTMQNVRGTTLAESLRRCATLSERLALLPHFVDVCQAIAYAHSRGIVHRDLKPQNIMVGEFGETVVLDWGLAKLTREREDDGVDGLHTYSELDERYDTVTGAAVGTPSYMSPEQATGRPEDIDERTDIWGLGAVLHALLTGRAPFDGDTPTTIVHKLRRVQRTPIQKLTPGAPPELVAIAERALQSDKAARYPSAQDLADDVAAYIRGARVSAYGYRPWHLAVRFARAHKAALLAAGLIFATLVTTSVLVWQAYRRERVARQSAEQAIAERAEEQLRTRYNLAQAYGETASRLNGRGRRLEAAMYAAASLEQNPSYPQSPWFDERSPASTQDDGSLAAKAVAELELARAGPLGSVARRASLAGEPRIRWVDIQPASDLFAVARDGPHIELWSLDPAAIRSRRTAPVSAFVQVEMSSDGSTLVAHGEDGHVYVWRSHHASEVAPRRLNLDADRGQVGLALDESGELLAFVDSRGAGSIFRTEDLERPRATLEHDHPTIHAAFGPQQQPLVTAGADGTIRLWDRTSGALLGPLGSHAAPGSWVAFSPADPQMMASAGADGITRIWSLENRRELVQIRSGRVGVLAFSRDGELLLASTPIGDIVAWDRRTGDLVFEVRAAGGHVFEIGATKTHLFAVSTQGYRAWTLLPTAADGLPGAPADALAAVYSRDGRWVAYGSPERILVRSLQGSDRDGVELPGGADGPGRFALSGSHVAAGHASGEITVWSVEAPSPVQTLHAPAGFLAGVSFAPDGSMLAAAGAFGVALWKVGDFDSPRRLEGERFSYNAAFSPDAGFVAAPAFDGSLQVWDLARDSASRWTPSPGHVPASAAYGPSDTVVFVCGTFGALACDPHQQTCRSFAATPCSLVVYEPDAAIIGLLHRSGEVSLYEWPSLRVQRIIKAKSEIKFFSFVPKTGRIAALSGRRLKAMGAGDARGALAASEQLAEAERAAGRTFAEELLGR